VSARSTFPVVFLVAAVAACNGRSDLLGSAALQGEPAVRTDSTSYHLLTTDAWHEVTIGVSYTNRTSVEVRIPTCVVPHPPLLEKLGPNGWFVAYSPVVLACLGPPVVIAPGEEYRLTYRVMAGRFPNQAPRFQVDEIPGTYRLDWQVLGTRSGMLPESQRTSNTFEITQ
jgi:hypothetical protein